MSYIALPFSLNTMGSGIKTETIFAKNLANSLMLNLLIKPNERAIYLAGSEIDTFIFDDLEVDQEPLTVYIYEFVDKYFPNLEIFSLEYSFEDENSPNVLITVREITTGLISSSLVNFGGTNE